MDKQIVNIITVDLEDYFMVSGFENIVKFEDWVRYESRIVINTRRILSILEEFNTRATFFVLGWVAEKNPKLIKEIYNRGHEISSHGYAHKIIYKHSPRQFREDIKKSKVILEQIIGEPILGYRAPSFSITKNSLWALDILAEEGFRYDSSIFPSYHTRGGIPGANRFPFKISRKDKEIFEFPVSTLRIFKFNIPISGGGYFRILPYQFIQWGIREINKQGHPVIFYIHPWELDINQPKIKIKGLNRIRHYINLGKSEQRLKEFLSEFKFSSIKNFFNKSVIF